MSRKSTPDVNLVLVDRLWDLYGWPEDWLPLRKMTVEKIETFPVQKGFVPVHDRPTKKAWDYGRIRFFVEEIQAGKKLDPIEVDNRCSYSQILPVPIVVDGHHRLAAAKLTNTLKIPVSYGGRVDLLRYLAGKRKTVPK